MAGQGMGKDTAIVIGVASRKSGSWSFRAVGQTLKVDDLRELADQCHRYI